MTWSTTHLAIQSFIFWKVLPEERKEFFRTHKFLFFLLSIAAIGPDFDAFFTLHRTYTHSFFIVALIWLVAGIFKVIEQLVEGSNSTLAIKMNWSSFTFLAIGWLWLMHIILDFGWGPLGLFYPFDNHQYDVDWYLIFDFDISWLPYWISGGGILVESYSFEEGAGSFLTNMTPSQIRDSYGTATLKMIIRDLIIHGLIFGLYLTRVLVPAISEIRSRKNNDSKRKPSDEKSARNYFNRAKAFSTKIKNTLFIDWRLKNLKKINQPLILVSIILVLSGFFIGPYSGQTQVDEYSARYSFQVLNDRFSFISGVTFDLPTDGSAEVEWGIYNSESTVNYTVGWGIFEEEDYSSFSDNQSDYWEDYVNGSLSYKDYLDQYIDSAKSFFLSGKQLSRINSSDSYNQRVVLNILNLGESEELTIISLLLNWTRGQSFITSGWFELEISSPRDGDYALGRNLMIIGFSTISVTFALFIWKCRKSQ
ncbi:MAG: hypothetical protein ACTSYA_00780 [Candidatus Kariarchaeaceae archaeon]